MKKHAWLFALAAALALSTAACGDRAAAPQEDASSGAVVHEGTVTPGSSASGGAQSQDGQEESSEDGGWQDVSATEYETYLKKYIIPYGNLKFYSADWTKSDDLGADRLFEFTLQMNFHFFNSPLDYGGLFGDEFTYLQVPEAWYDENYGLVYPQDIIENTAIAYFGADTAFLRTAKAYVPSKNGYAAPLQDGETGTDELMPAVVSVRRNGKRAEITFTLSPCDATGRITQGDVLTRVMTVEDREESFRYVGVKSA